MLVLKRTTGEGLVFLTSQGRIEVTVGRDGKLAINAPQEVKVLRKELERQDAARKEHK
jgi:sRNA-binding carbon storage regulator CsrA